jgi:hypothetical protein
MIQNNDLQLAKPEAGKLEETVTQTVEDGLLHVNAHIPGI